MSAGTARGACLASVPLGIRLCNQLAPSRLHPPAVRLLLAGCGRLAAVVAITAVPGSLAPAQSAARMTIRETLTFDA